MCSSLLNGVTETCCFQLSAECQVERDTHPEKHSCDSLSDTEWNIKALLLRAFQIEYGTFIQQFFVYLDQVEDIFFTLSSIFTTIPDASSSSKWSLD